MTKSEADNLLNRWGAWSRHNISIGWPPVNPIAKMMIEGGGAGHIAVSAGIPMAKEIQEADAIISKFRRGIKKAVKIQYIARLPRIEAAKRCRCSEDEFLRRVNYAIEIISLEL